MPIIAIAPARHARRSSSAQHAIPLTVDEFPLVQRHMPIVFSVGDDPVPLALMGLNEGVNVFVDDDGKLTENRCYVPAYVRRYPFMLARLRPDTDELSLCFDPTSDAHRRVRRWRGAVRGRPAERGDQEHPGIQRAVRAGRRRAPRSS